MVAFGPEYDRIDAAAAAVDDILESTAAFVRAFAGVGSVFTSAAAAFDAFNLARDAMFGIFPPDIWGKIGNNPFHCRRILAHAGGGLLNCKPRFTSRWPHAWQRIRDGPGGVLTYKLTFWKGGHGEQFRNE